MDIAELEIRIRTLDSEKKIAELHKRLTELEKPGTSSAKNITSAFGGLSGMLTTLKAALASAAAAFAALGIASFIREFVHAEEQVLRLRGALIATGQASEDYQSALLEQAAALQKVTRFSDEQVTAIQRELIMMGAQKEVVADLTKIILDYAEATGESTETITKLVARGLQGNVQMFQRYGFFQVDATRSKTEQFIDVLKQMRERSAGAAALLGGSDIGSVKQAEDAFSDLREEVGKFLLLLGAPALREWAELFRGATAAMKELNAAFESVKADSPFMKLITMKQSDMAVGLAGLLQGKGFFETIEAVNKIKAEQAAAVTAVDQGAIGKLKTRPDTEDMTKAAIKADELRSSLQQLAATSDFEAAKIANTAKFAEMARNLETLKGTLGEESEELLNMDGLMAKAMARQDQLIKNAEELGRLQRGMIESKTKGGLGADIRGARKQAGGATSLEEFEQAQRKLEILQAERMRRLEMNVTGPSQAFIDGWEIAVDQFGTISQRIAKVSEGLANSMETHMTDAIVGMIDGTKSVQEAFADMSKAILADLIRLMVQEMIVKTIMSAVFHEGGLVGGGGFGREVPTDRFVGAGRYASGGVAGDEVPIIAHRGEVIFNEEQFGALSAGMKQKQPKVEVINVTDPALVDERIAANPNAIINVISKNRQTVRAAMGLR